VTDQDLAVPVEVVERRIDLVRGQKVMLDRDLAELHGVPTRRLNEQVKRNGKRFPVDFMFQHTFEEARSLLGLEHFLFTSRRSAALPSRSALGKWGTECKHFNRKCSKIAKCDLKARPALEVRPLCLYRARRNDAAIGAQQ